MTYTITCAHCQKEICSHWELFAHVHPPPPALTAEELQQVRQVERRLGAMRAIANQWRFNNTRKKRYGNRV
jgi:hypothetical protein